MVDFGGNKGIHSRWEYENGTFKSVLSGKYLNVVNCKKNNGWTVNVTANDKIASTYFKVDDCDEVITLESMEIEGQYIQLHVGKSEGAGMGLYGVEVELKIFTSAD